MQANGAPASEKFALSTKIKTVGRLLGLRGSLPGERAAKGDTINVKVTARDAMHTKTITLKKKLAEGGEGSVYSTSISPYVAKVYKREKLTEDKVGKLKLMIDKPIHCKGVCFPEAVLLNETDEVIGYLMPEAKGHELGKSVFQPKLLPAKFPGWKKQDTVALALTILKKIKYLNDCNVILGDINPANILVVSPQEVYFVDCDSYQVEGYPCPVGTANFTAPEVQGRDYKTFLRTQAMENFAIATLLFMIMLPGKPPYSAVGGESPEANICNGIFPYPYQEDTDKTPPGKWGFIWSHMAYKTKEAFFNNFAKGGANFQPDRRYSADEWIGVFEEYLNFLPKMVNNDPMSAEIFPSRKKGENVVETRICKQCERRFDITLNMKRWEKRKSEQEGSLVRNEVCSDCKARPTAYSGSYSHKIAQEYSATRPASSAARSQTYPYRTASSRYGTASQGPATRSSTSSYSRKVPATSSSKITQRGMPVSATDNRSKTSAAQGRQTSKQSSGCLIFCVIAVFGCLIFRVIAVFIAIIAMAGVSSTNSTSTASTPETYSTLRADVEAAAVSIDEISDVYDYVAFGSYPTSSGGEREDLLWLVTKIDGDRCYLFSIYAIDCQPYNSGGAECTWETSSLRAWLNADFVNTAFSEEERARMVPFTCLGVESTASLLSLPGETIDIDSWSWEIFDLTTFPTPYAVGVGATDQWYIYNSQTEEPLADGVTCWWILNADSTNQAAKFEGCELADEIDIGSAQGICPVICVTIGS